MPIPSPLMTLSVTSGPVRRVVTFTNFIDQSQLFSSSSSHTPYITLAVLPSLFSSKGEECPRLIGSSPFLPLPFYL